MKNIIISALIAAFFGSKSTKDIQEKTKNASWFRTFLYLFLSVIFGVFFYKSYQVRTIINQIDINSLRAFEDSLHHPIDTIKQINIINNFKTFGSYSNLYIDAAKKSNNYIESGGTEIELQFVETTSEKINDRSSLTEDLKKIIEEKTNNSIDSFGSIYNFEFSSKSIPSFIKIYPSVRFDEPIVSDSILYTQIDQAGNVKGLDLGKKIGISSPNIEKGLLGDIVKCRKIIVLTKGEQFIRENINSITFIMPHYLANTINLFTAGDLSQYTYYIELNSDIIIKNMSVIYNVPIEVGNQTEEITCFANGFGINDEEVLQRFVGKYPMTFNVKLPSMANLQQIRSLFLTALLTAFISLFFRNLYYRIRKWTVKYKSNHKLQFSERRKISRKRVNIFKYYLYAINSLFLISVIVIVLLSANDYTFLVDYKNIVWIIARIFFIILAFLMGVIYLYKYMLTPQSNQNGQEETKTDLVVIHSRETEDSPS